MTEVIHPPARDVPRATLPIGIFRCLARQTKSVSLPAIIKKKSAKLFTRYAQAVVADAGMVFPSSASFPSLSVEYAARKVATARRAADIPGSCLGERVRQCIGFIGFMGSIGFIGFMGSIGFIREMFSFDSLSVSLSALFKSGSLRIDSI
jgi:hypothetical protein